MTIDYAQYPLYPTRWAVVSVKLHEVKKRFTVFVCTYHQGKTKITRQTFVPSMNIDDTNLMYLHGVQLALTDVPELSKTVIYINGYSADRFLEASGGGIDALGIGFHPTPFSFYKSMIADHPKLALDRRLAMSTKTDTYINPNHPVKVAQRAQTPARALHVYTDGSKSIGSKEKGYGLGIAVHDRTTGTVSVRSTWQKSVKRYTSNQFEFAGMLTAMNEIQGMLTPGKKYDITVHCDNMHAVRTFNEFVAADTPTRRRIIMDHLQDGAVDAAPAWMYLRRVKVTATWVKGHDGNVLNEATDSLATAARLRQEGVPAPYLHPDLLNEITEAVNATV